MKLLLGQGLLHHVFGAFTLLKHMQFEDGPDSSIRCSETLVIRLLLWSILVYKESDTDDTLDAATCTPPAWVPAAARTILYCLGEGVLYLHASPVLCTLLLFSMHTPVWQKHSALHAVLQCLQTMPVCIDGCPKST